MADANTLIQQSIRQCLQNILWNDAPPDFTFNDYSDVKKFRRPALDNFLTYVSSEAKKTAIREHGIDLAIPITRLLALNGPLWIQQISDYNSPPPPMIRPGGIITIIPEKNSADDVTAKQVLKDIKRCQSEINSATRCQAVLQSDTGGIGMEHPKVEEPKRKEATKRKREALSSVSDVQSDLSGAGADRKPAAAAQSVMVQVMERKHRSEQTLKEESTLAVAHAKPSIQAPPPGPSTDPALTTQAQSSKHLSEVLGATQDGVKNHASDDVVFIDIASKLGPTKLTQLLANSSSKLHKDVRGSIEDCLDQVKSSKHAVLSFPEDYLKILEFDKRTLRTFYSTVVDRLITAGTTYFESSVLINIILQKPGFWNATIRQRAGSMDHLELMSVAVPPMTAGHTYEYKPGHVKQKQAPKSQPVVGDAEDTSQQRQTQKPQLVMGDAGDQSQHSEQDDATRPMLEENDELSQVEVYSVIQTWQEDRSKEYFPGPKDILLGRGMTQFHHPGNVAMRKAIATRQLDFEEVKLKGDKGRIARSVLAGLVRGGSRFLMKGIRGKGWHLASFQHARRRISIALRDNRIKAINAKSVARGTKPAPPPRKVPSLLSKNKSTNKEPSKKLLTKKQVPTFEKTRSIEAEQEAFGRCKALYPPPRSGKMLSLLSKNKSTSKEPFKKSLTKKQVPTFEKTRSVEAEQKAFRRCDAEYVPLLRSIIQASVYNVSVPHVMQYLQEFICHLAAMTAPFLEVRDVVGLLKLTERMCPDLCRAALQRTRKQIAEQRLLVPVGFVLKIENASLVALPENETMQMLSKAHIAVPAHSLSPLELRENETMQMLSKAHIAVPANSLSPLELREKHTMQMLSKTAVPANPLSPRALAENKTMQLPSKTQIAIPANSLNNSLPANSTAWSRLIDNFVRDGAKLAYVHVKSPGAADAKKAVQILAKPSFEPSVQPIFEKHAADRDSLERQNPRTQLDATSTSTTNVELNDRTMPSSMSKEDDSHKDIKLTATPMTKFYDDSDEGTCSQSTDLSADDSCATVADDGDETQEEDNCVPTDEELEQSAFSYCEAALLPLLDSFMTAVESNNHVEVRNVLRQIKSRVAIMSAPFMEEYKFFRVIQIAKPFDLSLYRSVLRIAKAQYRRSKSLVPSGFQPVKIEPY